jgi:hypothetical protein
MTEEVIGQSFLDSGKARCATHPVFGMTTLLCASKEIQDNAIGITGMMNSLPEVSLAILHLVASSREEGILATSVSTALGLDSKSVYHYSKALIASELMQVFFIRANLSFKVPAFTVKRKRGGNNSSNLLLHSKFRDTSPAYHSYIAKQKNTSTNTNVISIADRAKVGTETRLTYQELVEQVIALLRIAKSNTLALGDCMTVLVSGRTHLMNRN